ncbi:mCG148359 [Mus musculus]|nr:mCG148359 [Mus musculus]
MPSLGWWSWVLEEIKLFPALLLVMVFHHSSTHHSLSLCQVQASEGMPEAAVAVAAPRSHRSRRQTLICYRPEA